MQYLTAEKGFERKPLEEALELARRIHPPATEEPL